MSNKYSVQSVSPSIPHFHTYCSRKTSTLPLVWLITFVIRAAQRSGQPLSRNHTVLARTCASPVPADPLLLHRQI